MDHGIAHAHIIAHVLIYRVRNVKFARSLKCATSKTLVNFMKKMMFLSKNWYFSVQKALIYYTFNKSHHNSFILLVFSHVANFRYVANFRFLTLLFGLISKGDSITDYFGTYYRVLGSYERKEMHPDLPEC